MAELPFRDRAQAGRLLGQALSSSNLAADSIVLALPRGGVPVGFEVAKILGTPMDVLVVRKLGAPWNPELALGAIGGGGMRLLDERLIRQARISRDEIERISVREAQEVERRETLYRAGRPALELGGQAVVLVDDGLATGSTMLLAVQCAKNLGASSVTVAVPVASAEAGARVRQLADDYICLATPEPLNAVGEWYENFRQVSDAEVREWMGATRAAEDRK